uniref:Uncharacterized protein n=1 Tax=Glossina palpalis gambiensis TaxID=67801 RepID=A0A1B0B0R4_9MUSC
MLIIIFIEEDQQFLSEAMLVKLGSKKKKKNEKCLHAGLVKELILWNEYKTINSYVYGEKQTNRIGKHSKFIKDLRTCCDSNIERIELDLSNNNITRLEANSFFMVTQLEELTLADNSLHLIDPLTFYDLNKLKRLNLQNCGLKSLTAHAFQGLTNLISLLYNMYQQFVKLSIENTSQICNRNVQPMK